MIKSVLPPILIGLLLSFQQSSLAQRFYPDDPIAVDHDTIPFDEPQFVELSPTFDLVQNTFGSEAEGPRMRAENVNTLGEVPDSSWFTNRIDSRKMSPDELLRGGEPAADLDTSQRLTVTGAALITVAEGLVVRDSHDDLYYIKFDPIGLPNLATAADHITTRFLYAIGYNVLPTSIAYIDAERLEIDPTAQVRMLGGKTMPLDREFIDLALDRAEQCPDGRFRVVAHRLPPGKLLGGFKFHGTRSDDPNDIFRHENRRELRGLRLISAWLNHYNCRSLNTMDVFLPESEAAGARGWVKHYLVDFMTALGSGYDLNDRIIPKDPGAGHEYNFWPDTKATLKTAATFGIWERPWMKIHYPYPKYREIGRIEADEFKPEEWKPDYPNAAFDRMLPDDAFWAAKLLSRFTDSAIRTIVHSAEYSDPAAEAYLVEVLVQRRDKILRHYFRLVNPLDRFRLTASRLEFANLGPESGLPYECSYEYQWFTFDNREEKLTPLGSRRYTGLTFSPIPDVPAPYLMVRIRTQCKEVVEWKQRVDIYLRNQGGLSIVGIERQMDNSPSD